MESTCTYTIPLSKLIKEFNLDTIYAPANIDQILISRPEINRPGLPLAGFFDYFDPERIHIIGRVEAIYLAKCKPAERREKIRAGEYDFSEDEISDAEEEEIPEELLETEEDIENERREAEKNKKPDRITNIICAVLGLAAVGFFIYKIIMTYFA